MALADDLQKRIQGQKDNISFLQRQVERAKGAHNWGNAAQTGYANQALTTAETALEKAQEELAKTQNDYSKATGNYEDLLQGANRDAYLALNTLFKTYNLGSLAGKIFDYLKNGYSADTISILLQDTSEYKKRFAANEERRKNGLPVLSPAEYLATEAAYKQVVDASGLPKGFFDKQSDYNDLLGRNVSPSELQKRVDLAVQESALAPEFEKAALKALGVKETDIVAYILDKDKALPFLTQAISTARIGAQALSQGLSFDTSYAAELAKQGVTADQARQGYAAIGDELGTLSQLGSIYGETWGQRQSEQAMFEGNAQVNQKKKRLASQERGAFSGSAGAAKGGLAQKGGAR